MIDSLGIARLQQSSRRGIELGVGMQEPSSGPWVKAHRGTNDKLPIPEAARDVCAGFEGV